MSVSTTLSNAAIIALLACPPATALAATEHYTIDPEHTFPSFEADHMGISIWRGKFNTSSGKVTLDKAADTGAVTGGTVDVTIDLASVDFGHDKLNEYANGPDLFDIAKYPQATYHGTLAGFEDGRPTRMVGELTLHGVTRPVELEITLFNCVPHPMLKREQCGADAFGTIERDDFGIDAGKDYGFDMTVTLRIQVEALHDA
ncbi:YceI family protein [Lysobacter sp. F6437]|uniref:YceI family protein n=1 Tax=Lysobacter sp. F6437 TaxID=3459296 RepID=UPI00403D8D51